MICAVHSTRITATAHIIIRVEWGGQLAFSYTVAATLLHVRIVYRLCIAPPPRRVQVAKDAGILCDIPPTLRLIPGQKAVTATNCICHVVVYSTTRTTTATGERKCVRIAWGTWGKRFPLLLLRWGLLLLLFGQRTKGVITSRSLNIPPLGRRPRNLQRAPLTMNDIYPQRGFFGCCGTYLGAVESIPAASWNISWDHSSSTAPYFTICLAPDENNAAKVPSAKTFFLEGRPDRPTPEGGGRRTRCSLVYRLWTLDLCPAQPGL